MRYYRLCSNVQCEEAMKLGLFLLFVFVVLVLLIVFWKPGQAGPVSDKQWKGRAVLPHDPKRSLRGLALQV